MTGAAARRPRVICHMLVSVDGRIEADRWPGIGEGGRQFELVHASYQADGWLCGRVTMEPFAKRVRSDAEVAREHAGGTSREDFVAPRGHHSFAFAIDPSGRLAWESNYIDGDHVVAIVTERVSDQYLAFLRERGVSYLLAGSRDIDLPLALEKIGARFGVRTLMLEGGGRINGGMLSAGLVDEVSLLVAPVADGRAGTSALFDGETSSRAGWRSRRWSGGQETSSGSATASSILPDHRHRVPELASRLAIANRLAPSLKSSSLP